MCRRIYLLVAFILTTSIGFSQKHMYVNSDAAYLRQFPLDTSKALIILHAPTKVEIQEISDRDLKAFPDITDQWVVARLLVTSGSQFSGQAYSGYLRKEDLVGSLTQITVPETDTAVTLVYSKITDQNELQAPKINYQKSSRGGCYYVNSTGNREYVSAERCEPKAPMLPQECPVDVRKPEEN